MIYAIARFDWMGIECTATLEPDGWKVPRSLGVEAALNAVAKMSSFGPVPGAPVENALDSILRIFPNAVIDRPPLVERSTPLDIRHYAETYSSGGQKITQRVTTLSL